MTDVSHYLGLLEDKRSLSHWGTITWISGLEPETALDILGGDPDSELSLSFDDCHSAAFKDFQLRGHSGSEILLSKAGPWLVCVEPFGDGGTGTLLALSKKGTAFSLLLHPHDSHTFTYAADAEALLVVHRIDEPWVEGPISLEEIVGEPPLLERGAEPVTWAANALAIAERLTGFRLTTEWLNAEHPCYISKRPMLAI